MNTGSFCASFCFCLSFPRKRESMDVVFAVARLKLDSFDLFPGVPLPTSDYPSVQTLTGRIEKQRPWIPAFAGMTIPFRSEDA